ncbi:MAG TPA: hypothetical protein VGB08_11485 [Allosphingosinicella sp.]|jgi:hypothetical protein
MRRLAIAAGALALAVSAAAPASAQLRVERRANLAAPVELGRNQGAILVGFRRPDAISARRHGAVGFARYDVEARDVIAQPRGARRAGDTNTYWVLAKSGDRTLESDHALMIVSAGDYVLFGAAPTRILDNTFCLGAPTFRVNPGEVVYFGDVTPYQNVRFEDGHRANAMAYSADLDAARAALQSAPALAAAVRPAELRNGATFGCVAQNMLSYAVPGAPELPPAPAPAPAEAAPAPSAPGTGS